MKTLAAKDFLPLLDCTDHHFTGPPEARQPENHGSVFHEEGRILYTLARKFGGNVLEIGSDLGISTRYIYEGLTEGYVVAVDYQHKWGFDAAWPRRIRLTYDTRALGVVDELRPFGPFSFSFIDGDHRRSGVMNDIKIALGLGIDRLLFHDTREGVPIPSNASNGSEVRQAIEDVFAKDPGWAVTHISTGCGLTWVEAV